MRRWKDRFDKSMKISWTSFVRIVGVFLSYDKKVATDLNIAGPLQSLKKCLNFWKMRQLTLLGKIQIIKALGISRFQYILNIVDIPKHNLKQVNKLLYSFLWNGPDKIARHTITGETKVGGLAMPDIFAIQKAQRINWLRRFCDNSFSHPWKLFLSRKLHTVGGVDVLLKWHYDLKFLPAKLSPFFHNMLKTWISLRYEPHEQELSINDCIWNNAKLLIARKSFFHRDMFDAGLMYLGQLYNNGDNVLDENANVKWGGDHDVVLDAEKDRQGGNPRIWKNSLKSIQNIMETFGLIDIWRVRNPNTNSYTWQRLNPSVIQNLEITFFVVNGFFDKIPLGVDVPISPTIDFKNLGPDAILISSVPHYSIKAYFSNTGDPNTATYWQHVGPLLLSSYISDLFKSALPVGFSVGGTNSDAIISIPPVDCEYVEYLCLEVVFNNNAMYNDPNLDNNIACAQFGPRSEQKIGEIECYIDLQLTSLTVLSPLSLSYTPGLPSMLTVQTHIKNGGLHSIQEASMATR
uniref:Uncharacterized protein LOC102808971 n=1 Tax=Saccoglossus kowalevskii TaxID=10224 RepID=A0ABM0MJF0_SACKO|nr:PREDICTED: uncharacterized protein LOC102808971 [Saccoglossus kowalevskii]